MAYIRCSNGAGGLLPFDAEVGKEIVGPRRAFVHRAVGNLYFWYYATLAMFRVDGEPWERWNGAMKNTLLPAQEADGSWAAISIYATNYAGDDREDRVYSTAMCVLTLEVYYRYFTPLLKVE